MLLPRSRSAVLAAMLAVTVCGMAAAAERRDPQCKTVVSKEEREARLQGRDPRSISREESPSDPAERYAKAKEVGNLRVAWGAIVLAQEKDRRKADALWRDYWCSEVLAAFEDRPDTAFGMLKAAAERGLPSAMLRLSQVYARGEFGQPADAKLAAEWRSRHLALMPRRHGSSR